MPAARPRRLYANRSQGEFRDDSLDQLRPPEHPVRDLWPFVEGLDLSALLARVRSVPGHAGAPAIDPRILLAVWLPATLDGVGSSRAVAERCEYHPAYRWVCGGVPVGYHTRSDFRTGHGAVLDGLLTQSVGVPVHEGLADLRRVAQDGLKVRAAAGAGSVRRPAGLETCLGDARAQVEALRSQADEDAGAADRVARLTAARAELVRLRAANAGQSPSRPKDPAAVRASTTDPACRKMTMPDGGFRPADNVQPATTTDGGVSIGVDATTAGTDAAELPPMIEQLEERFDRRPAEALVDGGFATTAATDTAERNGTAGYAPPREEQKQLDAGQDPYARKTGDTDATAVRRARMGPPEAKAIDKGRAATAEWANAQARNRGRYRVRVRGRPKVLVVVRWYARAHNSDRLRSLRAKAAAADGPPLTAAGGAAGG